jgi:hypothetical protein
MTCPKIKRKIEGLQKSSREIVKVKGLGKIIDTIEDKEMGKVRYQVHSQYLIKHKSGLYVEEEIEMREAEFYKGILVEDIEINPYSDRQAESKAIQVGDDSFIEERQLFKYDRLKAVQYAERWWNDYNPAYEKFDVDCTNYISQCLHAGGAPMSISSNRAKGWWMKQHNWSFSWTVANSMRWYLPGAKSGLRAREVDHPEELQLGDVICYDFQGDGRFDHTTIVTKKDQDGMPLVNSHTYNSRMRYWAYEDSTAYTDQIKYKFFMIVDDE